MKRNYSPLRLTKHIAHGRAIILVALILLTVLFARIIYIKSTDTLNQPTICYKTDCVEIDEYISSKEDFTGATIVSLVQKYKTQVIFTLDGENEALTSKDASNKIDASQKYTLQYGKDCIVIIPVNEK